MIEIDIENLEPVKLPKHLNKHLVPFLCREFELDINIEQNYMEMSLFAKQISLLRDTFVQNPSKGIKLKHKFTDQWYTLSNAFLHTFFTIYDTYKEEGTHHE